MVNIKLITVCWTDNIVGSQYVTWTRSKSQNRTWGEDDFSSDTEADACKHGIHGPFSAHFTNGTLPKCFIKLHLLQAAEMLLGKPRPMHSVTDKAISAITAPAKQSLQPDWVNQYKNTPYLTTVIFSPLKSLQTLWSQLLKALVTWDSMPFFS